MAIWIHKFDEDFAFAFVGDCHGEVDNAKLIGRDLLLNGVESDSGRSFRDCHHYRGETPLERDRFAVGVNVVIPVEGCEVAAGVVARGGRDVVAWPELRGRSPV